MPDLLSRLVLMVRKTVCARSRSVNGTETDTTANRTVRSNLT
jgi:hypothetical protein